MSDTEHGPTDRAQVSLAVAVRISLASSYEERHETELDFEFGFRNIPPVDPDLRIPVQARSVRTRSDIVAAALKEFSERGYAVATAKSIAERAGVATGTFYHYFPDKDVVLRELAAERASSLEQRMRGSDLELAGFADSAQAELELRRLIRADIRAYLDYHSEDRGLHAVISERRANDPTLGAMLAEVEARGMKRIARGLADWGFTGDAEATAFMIFSLVDGAVHNHVLGQPALSDARFIEALTSAIVRISAPQAGLPAKTHPKTKTKTKTRESRESREARESSRS